MASLPKGTTDLDVQTVEELVRRCAETRSNITYGELSRRIKAKGMPCDPRAFSYPLGRIQEACFALGLPALPVVAVSQAEGMRPKGGFIEMYRELHPELASVPDDELIDEQLKEAHECTGWQALLDLYGIEYRFPGPATDPVVQEQAHEAYEEGERRLKTFFEEVERNPTARRRCLELKGSTCAVCGFNSEERYGVPGIIEVHHVNPLAEKKGVRKTDPERDLVPLCPNCHALVHSKREPGRADAVYTIDEAREMLESRRSKPDHGDC